VNEVVSKKINIHTYKLIISNMEEPLLSEKLVILYVEQSEKYSNEKSTALY